MRCPHCGARNSEDAAWCTQCYADVTSARPDDLAPPPTSAPAAAAATPPPGGVARRDVRERDGAVEWRCATCDGWTPLEAPSCSVCGTARRGFGEEAGGGPRPDVGQTGIVGASLLLPGLGHVLAGRPGSGMARALLAVLWLLGGVALVVGNPGVRALPGWLLLAGAVVLWVATAIDAQRLVSGDPRELLGTRGLGLLAMVVTLGLVLAVGVAVLVRS